MAEVKTKEEIRKRNQLIAAGVGSATAIGVGVYFLTRKPKPEPEPEPDEGQTECRGADLYVYTSGEWILKQANAPECTIPSEWTQIGEDIALGLIKPAPVTGQWAQIGGDIALGLIMPAPVTGLWVQIGGDIALGLIMPTPITGQWVQIGGDIYLGIIKPAAVSLRFYLTNFPLEWYAEYIGWYIKYLPIGGGYVFFGRYTDWHLPITINTDSPVGSIYVYGKTSPAYTFKDGCSYYYNWGKNIVTTIYCP